MAPVALIMSTGEMSQLLQNKGGRPPIALQEQSSPEGYASEVDSEVDEDEDSLQVLAALVPVPSKSSISSPSAVSGLLISPKSRSRDSDEDSADEGYYGVDDDNSDENLIDNIFSALLLARNDKKILDRHTYEPSRQDKELSNTTREAIFSNMILTTAEHNELRLRPLVLNCRKPRSGWEFVRKLPVLELPKFMATEKHDWAPRKYERCLAVVERPYGDAPSSTDHQHPSEVAVGIEWRPEVPITLREAWSQPGEGRPVAEVLRITHRCSGACKRVRVKDGKLVHKKRDNDKDPGKTCSTQLKILVQADDLSSALVYTLGNHEGRQPPPNVRRPAPFIRALAHQEVFRQANTPTLAFQSECVLQVCTRSFHFSRLTISSFLDDGLDHFTDMNQRMSFWEKQNETILPQYRKVGAKQLRNMFRAKGRQNAQHGSSLYSLARTAELRPFTLQNATEPETRGVAYFQPFNEKTKQPLICVLASLRSIDVLISFATVGNDSGDWSRFVGLDSSWRYLNENRAPLTALVATGLKDKLALGPMLLSSDVKADTLVIYLDTVKRLVEERAAILVRKARENGPNLPGSSPRLPNLLQNAEFILENQWQPPNFMIDKCRTELNALTLYCSHDFEFLMIIVFCIYVTIGKEKHNLNFHIRLCQFHVVQAIIRWSSDRNDGERGNTVKPSRIARKTLINILYEFRSIIQRFRFIRTEHETDAEATARRSAEFEEKKRAFFEKSDAWIDKEFRSRRKPAANKSDVTKKSELGCNSREEEQLQVKKDNFRAYFNVNWFVQEWIDDGLPLGVSRKTINTNNVTERAFKTIQQEHLHGRANKRIDNLVVVLLDNALVYDIRKDVSDAKPDHVLRDTLANSMDIWELGQFRPTEKEGQWVLSLRSMDSSITLDTRAPYCPCRAFKQTGNKCAHLWACDLLVHNGDYHTAMTLVDKVLDSKMPSALEDDNEPDEPLSEDELDERDEVDSDVEDEDQRAADIADVAEFQPICSTVKGRSARNRPLQPHRSKKTAKPKLSKSKSNSGVTLEHSGRVDGKATAAIRRLIRDKLNPDQLRPKTSKHTIFENGTTQFGKTRGRPRETKFSNSLSSTKDHAAAKRMAAIPEVIDIEELSDDERPPCQLAPLQEGRLPLDIYDTVQPEERRSNVSAVKDIIERIPNEVQKVDWDVFLDIHAGDHAPGLNLSSLREMANANLWLRASHIDAFSSAINRFQGQLPFNGRSEEVHDLEPTCYAFYLEGGKCAKGIGGTRPTERQQGVSSDGSSRAYLSIIIDRRPASLFALPLYQIILSRTPVLLFPTHVTNHWILVEARLSDCTFRVYDSLCGRENMRKEANESLDSIITFLETRAEGPIERITGGIDRPTVPYRNWKRLIVKAAKAGDQPQSDRYPQQTDGNACGAFVCRAMETLVCAAVAKMEPDWSWGPQVEPGRFYSELRDYMLDVTLHSRLRCDMSSSWFSGSPESPTVSCATRDPDNAMDSRKPHGNTQPGDHVGYSSDDAEEVSQHHISTPVSTRSVTFEGSRLARNVSSSADTVIIQHPQPGGLSHVGSVQGNNMSTARTRLASDQSDSPLNRPTLAFPSFSPVFATRDIEHLPKKCNYSAVPQESSPSAVVTPSKQRHSEAESVAPSSSRRKACSQCRDRKLKCDLGHPCSKRGKASQVFTCPMLLSSDVKADTLVIYLDTVKRLVEERAAILVRSAL
ncbi:BQ5605_C008g05331 [Microbotryum silenes-dioicae]|uniref:BQ5605_C008g05331 protein n=1 Tax=Microbotryum silenes-dioicae TaxID=796604 RepID=A0A2X0MHG3_9BASI|nr:BQ5605_C008g05331 [Microbotryum silenes-dioicae]